MNTTPTQQPEALRLANALDELDAQFTCMGLCGDAAEELRRLHAENEALKAKLAAQSMAVFRSVTTEREACAKVCDRRAEDGNDAEWCAERIRARGT